MPGGERNSERGIRSVESKGTKLRISNVQHPTSDFEVFLPKPSGEASAGAPGAGALPDYGHAILPIIPSTPCGQVSCGSNPSSCLACSKSKWTRWRGLLEA